MARFHSDMAALDMRPPIAEPRATESIDRDHRPRRPAARVGPRVPHRTAPRTSTSRRSTASASSRTTPKSRWCAWPGHAAATPTIRTAGRRSTSCCGSRRSPTSRRGARRSASAGPVGTSSARRWRCTSTARRSTCTAAAPTSSSRTTSARSRRASRSPASRSSTHWMHSAMVNYEGEKMSKSLGNLVFISDLLKMADPRAIRLALMRHHYRSGFEWYDTDLEEGIRVAAPAARRGRARRRSRSAAVRASACATRSTTTSTRRARSTRSTTSRARSSPAAATRPRPTCCASSARCSASTSRGPSACADRVVAARNSPAHRGALVPSPRPYASTRATSMSQQITITLPDGSTQVVDAGTTPAEVAASIGKRLAKAAIAAKVDGDWVDLGRPSTTTRSVEIVAAASADGREVLRHSTAHVLAEAVTRLFPGAKYAIGPAIADGFYYDFELPDGAHFSDDDLGKHRGRDARDRQGRPALRARRGRPTTTRSRVRRPAVQAGDHREGARRRGRRRGRGRGRRRRRRLALPQRRRRRSVEFVDLCRGPHVPSTGAPRRVQADEGRGRVLARQREGPDAPAHLRHRVGVAEGARRAPAPPRGSRAARPPQARRRARPVLVPRGDRFGARGVPSEGRHRPPRDGGLLARAARGGRLRVRELAAHHEGDLFETSGHLDWFADGMFPPMELDEAAARGHRLLPQADELPVPLPDLPAAARGRTASCRCGSSSSARCTATRSRASCTASRVCAA